MDWEQCPVEPRDRSSDPISYPAAHQRAFSRALQMNAVNFRNLPSAPFGRCCTTGCGMRRKRTSEPPATASERTPKSDRLLLRHSRAVDHESSGLLRA